MNYQKQFEFVPDVWVLGTKIYTLNSKLYLNIILQQITDFPFLREKIENTIISFIHGNSPTCKKNVLVLIEMQSVYMNTRHEEFVVNRLVSTQIQIEREIFVLRYYVFISIENQKMLSVLRKEAKQVVHSNFSSYQKTN